MDREGCAVSPIRGCFLLLVFILLFVVGVTLVMDQQCYNELSSYIPVYPGAEVELENHNFLRRYGIGETRIQFVTSDEPASVSRWYGERFGNYVDNRVYSYVRFPEIETQERDGEEKTVVRLYGNCLQP